jgi:hypothetical protein
MYLFINCGDALIDAHLGFVDRLDKKYLQVPLVKYQKLRNIMLVEASAEERTRVEVAREW